MRNQGLDYYLHHEPGAFRFQLKGIMDDEAALRLEQVWDTACSVAGDGRPTIDLTFVTSVEQQGRGLLIRWYREGAQFVANSDASRVLAESILGDSIPKPTSNTRALLPFLRSFIRLASGLPVLLVALLFVFPANAANLKSETIAAWDDYTETAKADFQQRIRSGGCFLWALEDPDRAAQVRAGDIVVAPAPGPNPKKVPGGLIHHWMGSMFLPHMTIERVVEVTRDYDRYKDYYQPAVIDSKTITREEAKDRFSMRVVNRAFFLRTALDADYQTSFVHLDDRRIYSISRTTRLQEIADYGQAGEHSVPEGEGGGYIWKLFSIARFEQRDAGVYVELEAIALSREIPSAARFLVDPIVRRVSRNSLLISLQQTEHALRANGELTAGGASGPVPAGSARFPGKVN